MKDVTPKETRDERIARMLTNNPEAMETIFNHVAQGGTLVELAKTWDIPYWSIAAYLAKDPGRDKIVQRAMILRTEYWIEKIKQTLNDLNDSNIQDLYQDDGSLLNPKDMPRTLAASIAAIESVEYFEGAGRDRMQVGWVKKVKFWDKTKSIEMLAKVLSMFVEKHEHTHTVKLEDLVGASQDIIDVDKSDTSEEI